MSGALESDDLAEVHSLSAPGIKKFSRIVGGILLLLFLFGIIPWIVRERRAANDAHRLVDTPANVEIVKPRKSPATSSLNLPADVRPFQTTLIFPRANGYLRSLLVDIGDHVTEGQTLAEIDSPEVVAQYNQAQAQLNQSRAALNQAISNLELAQVTLNRYERFSNSGAVSKQDLDERRAALKQMAAAKVSADANVSAAEAEVQRLSELQSFTTITAPFPGVIATRNFDAGALLSPTQTKELFRIERTDILRVFVSVPQHSATDVKVGAEAALVVRNFPDQEFAGKISRTAGSIEQSTRTMVVEVDVPNSDGRLVGGMYGSVKLPVSPRALYLVPTSAILFDAHGTRVAVVVDSKVQYRGVSLGSDFGSEIEVLSGLDGPEQVVSNPGQRIGEGKTVNIVSHEDNSVEPKAS